MEWRLIMAKEIRLLHFTFHQTAIDSFQSSEDITRTISKYFMSEFFQASFTKSSYLQTLDITNSPDKTQN